MAAATFTKASYSTPVIEKRPYVAPSSVTNVEREDVDASYEQHSLITSADGNVVIMAGSGLGGGTAINWGCCLETPANVRIEWVEKAGLTRFRVRDDGKIGEFDEHLNAVRERVGATGPTPPEDHSAANRILLRGCDALDLARRPTSNNF